jgi:uncharacterized membrane protein
MSDMCRMSIYDTNTSNYIQSLLFSQIIIGLYVSVLVPCLVLCMCLSVLMLHICQQGIHVKLHTKMKTFNILSKCM